MTYPPCGSRRTTELSARMTPRPRLSRSSSASGATDRDEFPCLAALLSVPPGVAICDTGTMRTWRFDEVVGRLSALGGAEPRIVISGNLATPFTLVQALTQALERCRVFQLNAQYDFTSHAGIIGETPFVGPGMRRDPMLDYLPMRLSVVPRLFGTARPVDAVLLHTSVPRSGKVSLGIEVNILPAAIEAVRARG